MSQGGIYKSSNPSNKSSSRPDTSESFGLKLLQSLQRTSLAVTSNSATKSSTNKENCSICNCSFSLMNKRLTCKGCSESMCYAHSSLLDKINLERICDNCMHQMLVKQAEEEIAEIKQRYSGDISFSLLEREEKTRLIKKAIGRHRKLEIEFKEKTQSFRIEEEENYQKLKKVTEEVKTIEEEIEQYKYYLECQITEEQNIDEKLKKTKETQSEFNEKLISAKQNFQNNEKEASKLKQKAEHHISIEGIKNNICQICNNNLAEIMPNVFQPDLTIKKSRKEKFQEMTKQVCSCIVF